MIKWNHWDCVSGAFRSWDVLSLLVLSFRRNLLVCGALNLCGLQNCAYVTWKSKDPFLAHDAMRSVVNFLKRLWSQRGCKQFNVVGTKSVCVCVYRDAIWAHSWTRTNRWPSSRRVAQSRYTTWQMESPLQMALNIQEADEALRNDNDLALLSVFRGREIFSEQLTLCNSISKVRSFISPIITQYHSFITSDYQSFDSFYSLKEDIHFFKHSFQCFLKASLKKFFIVEILFVFKWHYTIFNFSCVYGVNYKIYELLIRKFKCILINWNT